MTMLQSERRTKDPYPFTWEIPAGHPHRLAGAGRPRRPPRPRPGQPGRRCGLAWPASRALFTSLPAVLAGDPKAGLATLGGAASPAALAGWIIIVELLRFRRHRPRRLGGCCAAGVRTG